MKKQQNTADHTWSWLLHGRNANMSGRIFFRLLSFTTSHYTKAHSHNTTIWEGSTNFKTEKFKNPRTCFLNSGMVLLSILRGRGGEECVWRGGAEGGQGEWSSFKFGVFLKLISKNSLDLGLVIISSLELKVSSTKTIDIENGMVLDSLHLFFQNTL